MVRIEARVHSGPGKHRYEPEGAAGAMPGESMSNAFSPDFTRNRDIKFGSVGTQQAVGNLSHGTLCRSSGYH